MLGPGLLGHVLRAAALLFYHLQRLRQHPPVRVHLLGLRLTERLLRFLKKPHDLQSPLRVLPKGYPLSGPFKSAGRRE